MSIPPFSTQWECLFSHRIPPGDGSQKQTIGSRNPRRCRFCGRTDAEVSFRNVAHVYPAAFGNRSLFTFEECDDCNDTGSRLEDDLAKFLSLPRALGRIPARKGFPKIKTEHSQDAYAQIQGDDRHLYVFQPTDDEEGVRIVDDGKRNLKLTVEIPAHRPLNVAKSLARMALFSYPHDLEGFDTLRGWVTGTYTWFPVPLVVIHLPVAGNTNTLRFMCHRFKDAPGRNVIRLGFLYSKFLTIVPIALDQQPLPERLPLVEYPPQFQQDLFDNTSTFMIDEDFVEQEGISVASVSYDTFAVTQKDTPEEPTNRGDG